MLSVIASAKVAEGLVSEGFSEAVTVVAVVVFEGVDDGVAFGLELEQ